MGESPLSSFHSLPATRRRGSVLLIVIVLLLLLAILGTAYLSTTRSDRVASAQNLLSVNTDAQVDGLANSVQGLLADNLEDDWGYLWDSIPTTPGTASTYLPSHILYRGLYSPTNTYNEGDIVEDSSTAGTLPNYWIYKGISPVTSVLAPISGVAPPTLQAYPNNNPANSVWQPTTHYPFISEGQIQPWLADRIPQYDTTANAPYWQNITQALLPITPTATGSPVLVPAPAIASVWVNPSTPPTWTPSMQFEDPSTGPIAAPTTANQSWTRVYPTFKAVNGVNLPAMILNQGAGPTVLAGDADGDGIADCLLFRVPGASFDGLTWYAGIRIIDDNSAINVNTAWSRENEIPLAGSSLPSPLINYFGLFQSSVGLQELINTGDSLTATTPAVVPYRFGNQTPTAAPYDEYNANSYSDNYYGTQRTDFNYITQSDVLYQLLTRRMDNPGFIARSTRCQPIPWGNMGELAYHFGLLNPNNSSKSLLETLLPNSLVTSTPPPPSSPYTSISTWWNSFDFPLGTNNTSLPLRSLLVTRNPVSNYIAPLYDPYNSGEPLQIQNFPTATAAASAYNYVPNAYAAQVMLPYGVGSVTASPPTPNPPNSILPPPTIAPYNHFRGAWSSTATYYPNDIVLSPSALGGDNRTYIWVGATSGNTAVPTVALLAQASNNLYQFWHLQPWSQNPVKTNVNTATFPELYRAFWSVMAGNPTTSTPFGYTTPDALGIYDNAPPQPPAAPTTGNLQYEFRSPLRDPTNATVTGATRLDPTTTTVTVTNTNTMLLRAALAAVNTLGLRDNSQNVISRTVYLNGMVPLTVGGTPVLTTVEARVYSAAPQPIISEVYANNYSGADPTTGQTNPSGYVAIELFNPYSVALTLTNWQIGYVNRPTSGVYPNLQLAAIGLLAPANTPVVIQPHGYLLLENCNYTPAGTNNGQSDPQAATYRPADSKILPPLGSQGAWTGPYGTASPLYGDVYVPFLENVISGSTTAASTVSTGGEFVLLRPRRADGFYTSSVNPASLTSFDPTDIFNEGTPAAPNLYDLVPVDSYDFTNLSEQLTSATTYTVWSYIRAKGPGYLFNGTYPGQYSAGPLTVGPRETGTYDQGNLPIPTVALPNPTTYTSVNQPAFGLPAAGSYTNGFPPIQIYNLGSPTNGNGNMHWPNAVLTPQNTNAVGNVWVQQFPFGAFSRNGDMLEIPFIGAYRIRTATQITAATATSSQFVELNSLPMDTSMAAVDDGLSLPSTIDQYENIGRFCPMATTGMPSSASVDFYSFSRNLFRYLTVQSSSDDDFPNFDPGINDVVFNTTTNQQITPATSPAEASTKFPPALGGVASPAAAPTVSPVYNRDATATNQTAQDNVGVEGLININTASAEVLSMLPFVQTGNAGTDASDDAQIAQDIVNYRNIYGPFSSIFDLNKVIPTTSVSSTTSFRNVNGFQNGNGAIANMGMSTYQAQTGYGLISPPDTSAIFPNLSAPTTATGMGEDWQSDYAVMSRISNLVTTRSDTFTVYVVLQGWANAGGSTAIPKVTRRYAFIADRSAISADPSSRFVKTIPVPND